MRLIRAFVLIFGGTLERFAAVLLTVIVWAIIVSLAQCANAWW
jgi:hypothetical protein